MTEADKKALIKKYGARNKGFDSRFKAKNRDWFVERIIASAPASATVATVEQKITTALTLANALLKTHLTSGFGSSLKSKWSSYNMLTSRTQIVYGLVATNPRFADPAFAGFVKFNLERRFRAIQRMTNDVNPNEVAFDYPNSTPVTEPMQVNASASPLWTATPPLAMPFLLSNAGKADPVKAIQLLFDPHPKDHGKQCLFFCDPALSAVLLDSLLVSRDADTLMKAMANRHNHYLKIDNPGGHFANDPKGQRLIAVTTKSVAAGQNVDIEVGRIGPIAAGAAHILTQQQLETDAFASLPAATVLEPNLFLISHQGVAEQFKFEQFNPVKRLVRAKSLSKPYPAGARIYLTRQGNALYQALPFHILTDDRPKESLFEQTGIPASDLQVGDHVYFVNHPLYRKYYPDGAWGGEHALLTEIGARDSASSGFRSEVKLSGHGLEPMTLLEMGQDMLSWINKVLAMIQALTLIHLRFLKAVAKAGANSEFDIETGHPLARHSTSKVTFAEASIPGSTDKMHVFQYKIPYKYSYFSDGKTNKIEGTKGFVIKELALNRDQFQIFNNDGIDLSGTPAVFINAIYNGPAAGDRNKPSNWIIPFFNAALVQHSFHALFKSNDKTKNILVFDDLIKAKPLLVTDETSEAFVTRPRVDFDPAYQTFLSSNGAI